MNRLLKGVSLAVACALTVGMSNVSAMTDEEKYAIHWVDDALSCNTTTKDLIRSYGNIKNESLLGALIGLSEDVQKEVKGSKGYKRSINKTIVLDKFLTYLTAASSAENSEKSLSGKYKSLHKYSGKLCAKLKRTTKIKKSKSNSKRAKGDRKDKRKSLQSSEKKNNNKNEVEEVYKRRAYPRGSGKKARQKPSAPKGSRWNPLNWW
jgi:hypothetical protein